MIKYVILLRHSLCLPYQNFVLHIALYGQISCLFITRSKYISMDCANINELFAGSFRSFVVFLRNSGAE